MTPSNPQNTRPNSLDQSAIAKRLPFGTLSPDDAQAILAQASIEQIQADEIVFDEGDKAAHFYLLLDGVMRILRTTEEGEQVVVLHIVPGDMFGIARAFDHDTYHMTARAAAPGLALCWPSDVWERLVDDYAGFRSASKRAVGARMDELHERIVEMSTRKVEQRIAQAILRLIAKAGNQTAEGIEINFPITRQDISEMTGTTLHSVSRHLSEWQKSGIVESRRRRVIVRRPDELPV